MKLPGGTVEDSKSVAGVVVEGEILHFPTRISLLVSPNILLADFSPTELNKVIVESHLSRAEDLQIPIK